MKFKINIKPNHDTVTLINDDDHYINFVIKLTGSSEIVTKKENTKFP